MPTALPPEASPPGTGTLSPREALGAIAQAAEQVAAWHNQGLVHLAIDRAALAINDQNIVNLTMPAGKRVLGGPEAPAGLPPEYAGALPLVVPVEMEAARAVLNAANCQLDPRRIDVYQLGELLVRLMTGEPVERYLQSPRVKGGVPRPVSEVIDQALGFDPARRFGSASELATAIDRALAQDALAADKSSASDTSPSLAGGPRQSDTSTGMVAKAPPATGDLPFTRLGQYEIVARLGSGGMGDVYQGYDADLDRYVAIKVLPAELARSSDFVIRFRSEAAAAAKVEHPNIVPIYTIGSDQGHHFFAMQYVAGQSLAQALAADPKPPRETTLAIVEQVVSGLAAAHRHGLVHRDIKPGNILLAEGGRRALLADFGLVKSVAQESRMTATGVIMGTVDYLSPEQGRGKAVDGRSDLYSIGVLLYQMLAGRLPFMADSPTAMIFQHAYEPPPPLSLAAPDVPPGLAAVVHRLLAKSPDERHATCEELLEDLRALRAGQTPPHAARGAAGRQATAIIVAPQFGDEPPAPEIEPASTAGWSWSNLYQHALLWLGRQAPEVVRRLQNTQQQVDGAVFEYQQRSDSLARLVGEAEEVQRLLSEQLRSHQAAADQAQQRLADGSAATEVVELATAERHNNQRAAQELQAQLAQQRDELESMQLALAKSKAKLSRLQGQRDALNARLKIAQARYGLADARPRRQVAVREIAWIAFLCSALIVASIAWMFWTPKNTKRSSVATSPPAIETGGKSEFAPLVLPVDIESRTAALPASVTCIQMLPTEMIVGASDGSLIRLEIRDGTIPSDSSLNSRRLTNSKRISHLAWNSRTRRLASSSQDGEVLIWDWDWQNRKIIRQLSHGQPVEGLAFSPDGSQLLTGTDSDVRCWDVVTGNELERFSEGVHGTWNQSLVWMPDGTNFVEGGRGSGGAFLVALDHSKRLDLQGSGGPILNLASLEGGNRIIGVSQLTDVRIWNATDGHLETRFGEHVACAAYGPWRTQSLTGDSDGKVSLWNIETGRKIQDVTTMSGPIDAVAVSSSGEMGVAASGRFLRTFPLPRETFPYLKAVNAPRTTNSSFSCLAFAPDSSLLVAGGPQQVFINALRTGSFSNLGEVAGGAPAAAIAVSPDGGRMLVAHPNVNREGRGAIELIQALKGVTPRSPVIRRYRGHPGGTNAACFARHGAWIVSAGNEEHIRIWETSTAQELQNVNVGFVVRKMAVTPDGRRAVVTGSGVQTDVWNLESNTRIGELSGHALAVQALAIARDADRVVTASGDRTARVFDLGTLQQVALLEHPVAVSAAIMTHDGKWVVTGAQDGALRTWKVEDSSLVSVIWAHQGAVTALTLSHDGTTMASAGDDVLLCWWDLPVPK